MIILFLIIQSFAYSFVRRESISYLDASIENSAKSVHNFINFVFQQSIQNYLKGRVEDSIYSVTVINAAVETGKISAETGAGNARSGILGRKIGESGYFYVINSEGTVIIHPEEELIGRNFSEFEHVKVQIKNKSGYLEYEWQNPGEITPRKKALYMEYFEPWDWIITASVYREEFSDLLDLSQLEPGFLNPSGLEQGYKYIVDRQGNLLIHPFLQGKNIYDLTEDQALLKIFDTSNETQSSGITEYYWQNSEKEKPKLRRAYYTWLPGIDMGIVSTFVVEDYQKTAYKMLSILHASNLLLLFLTSLLLLVLIKKITAPLSNLTEKILSQPEIKGDKDFNPSTKDEILITEQALNVFIRRLKEEKENSEKTLRENKILARFPNDAQFPIIRIRESGEITFTNNAAKEDLLPLLDINRDNNQSLLLKEFYTETARDDILEKSLDGISFFIFRTPIHESREIYLHFYDLTTEHRFQTLQNIWQNVFQTSIEGIMITDADGNIERINNSFTRVTGYTGNEIIGKHTRILKSNKYDKEFYKEMWHSLNTKGSWKGEIWNRRKSGEIYPEWLSISSYIDTQSHEKKFMAIFHDISDIHQKEEELAFVSSHDILTSLPNRSLYNDRVKQALLSADRTGLFCAVITLDIHGFSRINDHMGQIWGDRYLNIISELLQKTIRSEDTLARLGSDDFAILLPRLEKKDQCMDVLYRIIDYLEKPITLDGKTLNPSMNIGISIYPDDADTAEALVQKSNIAMIKCKSDNPGRHQFYDESLDRDLQTRFEMELALKQAVEHDQFRLMYQPKGDLNSGKIVGFEALIRWEHPEKGTVSPVEFIPVLEETGLIVKLGEWIIREACRFVIRMKENCAADIQVGINISNIQFDDPDFVVTLNRIMDEEGVTPQSIDLEITESMTAMETGQTIGILEQLHDRHFSISIDDFGTGYSSLQYLNELPFDVIKIDRSFIAPLPADEKRLTIVRSIIGLAKNYSKLTVAEGIETAEQERILREEGCDIIQGYYLSKPLTENDAYAFINKRKKL
ncbi:MAG: EAL domain-containing protein [Spirochaetales bacterium]|nr:EAL domain-containing protein [Spirochaetales bacterium]